MKKVLLILICIFQLTSCGEIGEEAENLATTIFTTKVNDAGEGIDVKDPSSMDVEDTITLTGGYFEFWFNFTNKNSISIVITNIKVDLIRGDAIINSVDFIPQKHIPAPGIGDPNQKYFAHLDPDSETVKVLGGLIDGRFYIEGLERDDNGDFLYTVRVTLDGFLSKTTRASEEDPFMNDDGVFQRIVVTSVNSR